MIVQIGDHQLFYAIHGQGPPMLLLHGGPKLDHTCFRPWLDPLAEYVRLVYSDQPGLGRSTAGASNTGVTFENWFAYINGLRGFLKDDRLILFGHGSGSFMAQAYAQRYSNDLNGLILCCPAPALDDTELAQIAAPTLILAGQLDWFYPPTQAERLHASLPNSTLVILDGRGHFPFSEAQDQFIAVVGQWLTQFSQKSVNITTSGRIL